MALRYAFFNCKGKNVTNNYLSVGLIKNRKQKSLLVHRLVAEAFIPNPENKPYVNHINGRKDDDRVENLEWCTASENATHAIKTGLNNVYKQAKPVCKMDETGTILEIYKSSMLAAVSLGKSKICGRNIRKICTQGYGHCGGFRWKWLEEDY